MYLCAAPKGFAPFWSENGCRLCSFWSGIGYGFWGHYGPGLKTGVKNDTFLVWNRVRTWRTGRHTPTKNSQKCPLGYLGFRKMLLKINILSCLSEQRESSVINRFLQSRLPTRILKCFAPFITFQLSSTLTQVRRWWPSGQLNSTEVRSTQIAIWLVS